MHSGSFAMRQRHEKLWTRSREQIFWCKFTGGGSVPTGLPVNLCPCPTCTRAAHLTFQSVIWTMTEHRGREEREGGWERAEGDVWGRFMFSLHAALSSWCLTCAQGKVWPLTVYAKFLKNNKKVCQTCNHCFSPSFHHQKKVSWRKDTGKYGWYSEHDCQLWKQSWMKDL